MSATRHASVSTAQTSGSRSHDRRAALQDPAPADASRDMARFAANTRFEDLSEAAKEITKRSIIDTIGVINAGTRGQGHDRLVAMVERGRGAPESSVIGFGTRLPAWMAALANGAMARAMNFDDGHDRGSTHPSSVVVPSVLALAERVGDVDGRAFLTAVAVGNEVICRLGTALAQRPGGVPHDGWFLSSVLGVFGAAAACCRVLGLDEEETRHAFGIALFEASGTLEAFSPTGQSSMMRGMVTGLTAKSAVLVASMAQAGITGVPDSLEGRFGLFPVYFGGSYDRDALTRDLGREWALTGISLKAWPTMRYCSAYVDAVGRIVSEHDLVAGDIAEIRVHVAGYVATRFEPLDEQRRPRNYNHAGHALPYLVAAMAARRRLTIDDLAGGLGDPDVLALAQRVVPVHDPAFGGDNRLGPAKVVVETRNGALRERVIEVPYGDPRDPMTLDDLGAKFRGCMAYRRAPLAASEVDAVLDSLADLEHCADVAALARRLA